MDRRHLQPAAPAGGALILLLGCVVDPCTEPGTVCTVAGTGDRGYNGQDLPALETWLYLPSAVDLLPDGRPVIVEFGNFLVRVLEEDGTLGTLAGNAEHAWAMEGAANASPLENPVDTSVGPDGAVYLAEYHTGRVLRVKDGLLEIIAGTGETGFSGDDGPATEATLSYFAGVLAAPDGTIWIADTENHRLRRIGSDDIIETCAGTGVAGFADGLDAAFAGPQRLAWDGDSVLVADTRNHAIRRYDPTTGAVTTVAGTGLPGFSGDGGPPEAAELREPFGVAVGEGGIWIADSGNHVVRRIRDGGITTVAGTPGEPGFEADPTTSGEAHLSWPVDMVEGAGRLTIADMQNGAVRTLGL